MPAQNEPLPELFNTHSAWLQAGTNTRVDKRPKGETERDYTAIVQHTYCVSMVVGHRDSTCDHSIISQFADYVLLVSL